MSNRRRGGRPVSNHDEDEEIYEELYSYAFSRDPTGEAAERPGQEDPPLQAQQDDDDGNDEATEFDWNPIAGNGNRQGIDIGSEGLARTILEFILRNSRHVRLWSSGSVHITDGRLENNDSSDDDDEISLGYIYRPTSPQAEPCPDTSRIEGSTIQEELSPVSGAETTEKNITKLIMKRGNSSMNNFKCPRINFGRAERVQLNDRFLPNAMTTMKRFRQKVFCGQYSTDGNVFLSACQDQHIRLFDTTNGGFKLFRDIHAKDVGWSIVDTAYSPDQRFLIYSSWSDCIHLCNIYGDYETHVPLDLRPTDSRFCAFSVCFSEDNTHILAGGSDRCIYVYDRGGDTRSLKGRKKQEIPQDVWNIIPSSGDYLRNVIEFSGYVTREAIIRLKDKDELEKMFAFVRSMHETVDDKNAMFGIFSKNPERVTLLPGLQISFERFLDAIEQLPETDESKAEVKYRKTQPKHETPLTDSQKIVCIDILKSRMEDWIYRQESAREKLDEMQMKPENTFAIAICGHYDDVNSVSFADGSSNILYSGSDDGLCMVWDRRNLKENHPKPVGIFAGHTDGITYIDAKGDGRYLLSNSKDQTIKLWDMRRFADKDSVRECRKIVSSTTWDYRWESAPRRSRRLTCINGDPSIMTYRGHSVLQTLIRARFSPSHTTEQKYIYAGCASGNIVVYDVITGHIAAKLKGHKQCVRDVSWHPYEQSIMSSSWDCTVGKWQFSRSSEEDNELHNSKRKRTRVVRLAVS